MKYRLLRSKSTNLRVIKNTTTGELVYENDPKFPVLLKKYNTNARRSEFNSIMSDFGLVKTPYGWE